MSQRCDLIPKTLLRTWQFCCAFRNAFSRRGEVGIEYERLFEGNNGARVLIECREIASAIDQHAGIRRQHLEVDHVVFLESHRPISQTPGLEVRIWRVVKTLVAREVKNETFRNKLIGLRDPLGQVTVRLVGGQQVIRYVNWREA